jgi:hypothetical protein
MGWNMGWDVDDQSIHDDGRTLRPVRKDEYVGIYDDFGHRDMEPPSTARAAFVFRGGKLIPDTVYIHRDPFDVTRWESHYSDVFAEEGHPKFYYEASFAPVVDDHWRVVGHVGWADGCDICVPSDTVQKGSKFWDILRKRRLDEARQQLLAEADRWDRGPFPNSPFPRPTSSLPAAPKDGKRWRGPENCLPRHPTMSFDTIWDEARRGPLKDKSIEETYLNDLNYFVQGGGKALVGFHEYLAERTAGREDSSYGRYLDLKIYGSSGYRFQVLVSPDGYLQAVLGIEKVHPKTRGDKIISDILEGIDVAMTVLMIIDIVTIPVVLFRLGALVARKVAIRALAVTVDREAKVALELALQRARRELVGAMSGPEQAEAKTAWEKLRQKFWDAGNVPPRQQFSAAKAKEWSKKIADRMKELGIPKKNIGAGSKIIPPGAKTPKGKPYLLAGEDGRVLENGEAFNPTGGTRGGRVRSTPIDEYGGSEGGISVHGNVFDRWEGFDLWNDPTTLDLDRIDAAIAHEWSEFSGLSHWEAVELAPQTALPIRPRARELLREMAKWGNSEKAFTEFTKAEWNAIKAAGKEAASFEEKKAAAAAAKAVK